ncbi:MAG TPA: chemotaxis protein CheB [Xanthobacteraceae bacterium]|jgi:two-component system chemotaxis response regulator CheB|nr:chemotaxis protein CheB [Xanthobacteraceae bacterium]
MGNRDVLAIGASAGGIEALVGLVKNFPSDFPASIFLTIHLSNRARSELGELLTRAGPLRAAFAQDGEVITKSRIYIAPPNKHLLLDGEWVSLGVGPRENNARPAIDPMLRSAALCCGPRSVGVVLTGMLDDGAAGLWAVGQSGGITVVQDPKDAAFSDMPRAASERARPDHVVPLAGMSALLDRLVRLPAGPPKPLPPTLKYEVELAKGRAGEMEEMDKLGRRSVLTCPDCGGVMWEIDEGELRRYRCHVGHTYTGEGMGVALDESLRGALASALRALDERVALARKLRNDASRRGHVLLAENWADRCREAQREAEVIRESLRRMDGVSGAARETAG